MSPVLQEAVKTVMAPVCEGVGFVTVWVEGEVHSLSAQLTQTHLVEVALQKWVWPH